jgi:predicted phage terminase large subunit-like protein
LQTAQLDGPDVPIVIEQEPGSSGVSLISYLTKLLAGYAVSADRPTGDKATRAMPLAAQFEAGNVRVLRRQWTNDLVDEFVSFPAGAHDDQVDAAAGAFNKLTLGRQAGAWGRG